MSVTEAVPATLTRKKSSKVALLKTLKFALPVAALAAFFPETVLATTTKSKDLMAAGNETVKDTFGKDSSVVKWVILAEVIVGAIMYMTTKNI
ncbi:TPA: type IV conjugative transfer system pilin TraA, partial [Enterobacter roggenkampii]|nr:type IV conjugative transfer system pilin TraA [Enterobacter roggenkampii]